MQLFEPPESIFQKSKFTSKNSKIMYLEDFVEQIVTSLIYNLHWKPALFLWALILELGWAYLFFFFQMFPAYYIFNFLLSILLVLHVIWTYYIFKILYKALYSGLTEDARSDSEDDTLSSTNESLDQKKEN